MAQSGQLKQDTPQGPDITFERIRVGAANFRRHVERCPNGGHRHVLGVLQDTGNTKITHLDSAVSRTTEENILCLQIPVQDVSVVHVLECQTDLGEPAEDLALGKKASRLLPLLDALVQIASIRKVHHYEKLPILDVRLLVGDDERVAEPGEYPDLISGLVLLLGIHSRDIDLLLDKRLTGTILHYKTSTKCSLATAFYLRILGHGLS
mmetsp:Transcript_129152/g.294758  ORF Transcript_129152/g.294758 Transcript_129152/m.294758 type:complete len:208 (-) Transcript_129152:90-713(-)